MRLSEVSDSQDGQRGTCAVYPFRQSVRYSWAIVAGNYRKARNFNDRDRLACFNDFALELRVVVCGLGMNTVLRRTMIARLRRSIGWRAFFSGMTGRRCFSLQLCRLDLLCVLAPEIASCLQDQDGRHYCCP